MEKMLQIHAFLNISKKHNLTISHTKGNLETRDTKYLFSDVFFNSE